MNASMLAIVILIVILALVSARVSGSKKSFSAGVVALALAVLGVVLGMAWYWGAGFITSEAAFRSYYKGNIYKVLGYITSNQDGEKAYITALSVSGGGEYVYRFKNLPPKGFKSIKTTDGQEFFIPEK